MHIYIYIYIYISKNIFNLIYMYMSSYSSRAITFTFGQIPLGKV